MRLVDKITTYLCDYFKGSSVSTKTNVFNKINEHIPFVDIKVKPRDDTNDLVVMDFGTLTCSIIFTWASSQINGNIRLADIKPYEEVLNEC